MSTDDLGWRSLLFVPVTNERFITSALRTDADAIQLDLEDSIPVDDKGLARQMVGDSVTRVADQRRDVVVRVNNHPDALEQDLDAAVRRGLTAITLPKVGSPNLIVQTAAQLAGLEAKHGLAEGTVRLIAMIETAEGLVNAAPIAASSPRLVAVTIGPEDLALSLGCAVTEDAMYYPAMTVLTAARAAAKIPLGFIGSMAEYRDLPRYRQWINRARSLGFEGAFCIHPTQVPVLNETFLPTDDELAHASALVEAFDEQATAGRGAFAFEDRMIDAPVAQRASQLLSRAKRFQAASKAPAKDPSGA